MAIELCPLFALEKQFQAKNGANNTNGFLMVFLAGTDDPVITYSDYVGTRNPQRIVLDDNGRAVVICDKAKAYRLEVYDADGMLLWTEEPVYCSGTGGGGISVTEVVSTDGSITVDKSTAGSVTTYDIGLAPSDSDEFLEWIKCSEEDCDATWKPVYQSGTMVTEAGQGIKVHGGHLYHFTNTFTVDPNGTGINYDTFTVNMYCGDQVVDSRNFDIDTSVNDSVMCEFSYDLVPEEDSFVYFTLTIPSTCEVIGEVQCHRIYSGINAVPDTCATKQWVQETFDYNMSSKVDYSAIEYNQNNEITGISGSAIAAGSIDSAFVSSVASAYADSAVSSINSSFSSFSSEVTGNISSLSSTVSSISADMSSYVPFSGLEGAGGKITGISGSAFKGHEYTGISPVNVDNTADTISVDNRTLCVDSTMTAYNSGSSAVIGVNIASLDLSSKMDASASSLFYPNDNPSGFITGVDLTPYQLTADMSAYQLSGDYAYNSSVSAKLDASASSEFQPSGDYYSATNPSGFITGVDLTPYQLTADMSAYQLSGNYLSSTDSAEFVLTSQSGLFQPSGEYLSATESSNYYPSSNPSGFITGVDLSPYQLTADMSAYQPSGDYQTAGNYLSSTDSAEFLLTSQSGMFQPSGEYQPSGNYLSATESSNYYPSSNPSGFITGVDLTPYQLTADMSGYYTTANESGFVDSAYVEGQVSGKQDASAMTAYQAVSGMTAYQEVSGMTAYQPAGDYQPSGDYIYASALGIAEV